MKKPNSQKIKAAIILLLPLAVLAVSSFLFYNGYSPEHRTNNGELIEPPISIENIILEGNEGVHSQKWSLVHFLNGPCDESCWASIYKTRQVNVRLGKDSQRVNRYIFLSQSTELSETDLLKLSKEYPKIKLRKILNIKTSKNIFKEKSNGMYLLFDPLGNGILIYNSKVTGGDLLEDLKKLLKNSKIG